MSTHDHMDEDVLSVLRDILELLREISTQLAGHEVVLEGIRRDIRHERLVGEDHDR